MHLGEYIYAIPLKVLPVSGLHLQVPASINTDEMFQSRKSAVPTVLPILQTLEFPPSFHVSKSCIHHSPRRTAIFVTSLLRFLQFQIP
jgi:hypothetical protein